MKSFITLALCLVASAAGEKVKLGDLSTLYHAVSGEVFAVDDNVIMIKDFTYDGAGPDAFFWVGKDGTPASTNEDNTVILEYPVTGDGYFKYRDANAPVLKAYSNEQIQLRLPKDMKVGDLKWLSVWCRKFTVDFGSLVFPTDLNLPKSASKGDGLPPPLAPIDNSVAEPEPESEPVPESEPEAESEPGYDHDHDHNHVDHEPEPEPRGAASTLATSLATIASIVLAVIYM